VKTNVSRVLLGVALGAVAGLSVQCTSSTSAPTKAAAPAKSSGSSDPVAAWDVVYGVLQHPRCMNCHPSGNSPLQGEDSHAHLQYVARGADGKGAVGMRCETCHQTRNLDAPHLPPGAEGWHLPEPAMPLVFQGKSSGELCRQMRDPATNGGKQPKDLIEHMETPLVLWGWEPGPGRAAVPISHEKMMKALKTWIDGGCGCPGE
jgi:hypothetical protein